MEILQASYNIHNYVSDTTASFDEQPFSEIDGLVLTQVSNMDLGGSGIDIYSSQSKSFSEIWKEMDTIGTDAHEAYLRMSLDNQKLIEELGNSERYKNMVVSNFVKDPAKANIEGFTSVGSEEHMEQFAAVTISYQQDGETYNYVSYRATDGTSDGWAEDLAMLYSMETQAQSDSTAYMNIIAGMTEGYIVGGGHSKGGGDFEYAYLFCEDHVRERIIKGYVYDSPGLSEQVLSQTIHYDEYKRITDGSFICPQDSIIGQVLHEGDNATFVHSVESGFKQHDPYSWEIDAESNSFVPDNQTELSIYLNNTLDNSVNNMSQEEKEAFFKFVSYLLYNNGGDGIDGLGELFAEGWKNEDGSFNWGKLGELWNVISADWESMSPEEREAFISSLGTVTSSFIATTYDYAKDKVEVWFNQKVEQFERKIQEAYTYVSDWAIEKRDQFIGFMTSVYDAFVAGLSTVMSVLKLLDSNYRAAKEYLENADLLQFHTDDLRDLASRLWAINGRLENLDKRIDSLYSKVKWRDLWSLINADFKIGWSSRLNRCANCLNDTAGRFESVEQQLLQMLE